MSSTSARLPDAYLPELAHGGGCFVTVEGVSGSGKSTVVSLLADRLGASSLHVMPPAFQRRTAAVNAVLRPLPQLSFYLAGLVHASDLVRAQQSTGDVVTDRYSASVIANHAAVHGLDMAEVLTVVERYLPYLVRPTLTVYLTVSPPRLAERIATKKDLTESDRTLFETSGLLDRVLSHYAYLAERNDRSILVDTDDLSAEEVAADIAERVRDHRDR